jgi:hypothetical protein
MLADRKQHWSREGGPFDIIAIAVSVIVIMGGFFIVYSSSSEYRSTGTPIANATPTIVPLPAPAQQRPQQ